jgi:hypothetical protein
MTNKNKKKYCRKRGENCHFICVRIVKNPTLEELWNAPIRQKSEKNCDCVCRVLHKWSVGIPSNTCRQLYGNVAIAVNLLPISAMEMCIFATPVMAETVNESINASARHGMVDPNLHP